MPKRTDLSSILIIGAGPIIIGQACEFDYSGTQACKALKDEGYRIVLVNSNPATIMTDPELADATYIEPITPEVVARIIEKERPDALLPTMGGQTALNCALSLKAMGVLDKFGVEMIGATAEAIDKAEDRELFRDAMTKIGLETPRARFADGGALKAADRATHAAEIARIDGLDVAPAEKARMKREFESVWAKSEEERKRRYVSKGLIEAMEALEEIGLPAIIRPSFTMGGTGGGIAYNREEFMDIVERGLDASPTTEVLIEESVLGWKEFEMEVVRDKADNCIIICSIENVDPMGVHTGDSITIAPALTLTDKEYQIMRDAACAVLREIGVETGGSNVQFAINPEDGRMVVIEMNPRVSRSSALASKATGFPIAKVAARLAVGYTLDELANDITGGATPASFEPTIDYVVTKIPRFTFEKFPGAEPTLTTAMKSVGEVMAIGRTFQESLQKALRGLETGLSGLNEIDIPGLGQGDDKNAVRAALGTPTPDRLRYVAQAMRLGVGHEQIYQSCRIDRWFLEQIQGIVDAEAKVRRLGLPTTAGALRRLKAMGFSDPRLAELAGTSERSVRKARHDLDVRPAFKRIDTCAAEFAAPTAYMYSTYETPFAGTLACEARPSERTKIAILGGGPNRIGQGIEFDYCCCHAAFSLADVGFETIMVNCNPETVSTDYDTSDRLYFEPLTVEDVLEILEKEKTNGTLAGVIVQFGGQTPLKLAEGLAKAGIPILGTSPDAIDLAEDRDRFKRLLDKLELTQPMNGIAYRAEPPRRRRPRLPAGGAAVLRARRPRHADRPRRGGLRRVSARHPARHGPRRRQGEVSERQDRPDQHGARQEPAAVRPLPLRRDRDRRRRHRRRHRRLRRRHHGAHRGGRHPLRRQRLFAAVALAEPGDPRRDRASDPRPRAASRRRRPDERAVRHQGRRHLRARGQPARLAHGALRRQDHRHPGRQDRRTGDVGREARELRPDQAGAEAHRGQGGGVPVRPLPRRRHRARPGDEVDRRGDGSRFDLRHRLRQVAARFGQPSAALRHGVHLGARPGQGTVAAVGQGVGGDRLRGGRDVRHAAVPRGARRPGEEDQQGA
jgi:carbamoyl-phosphate synthase large subunit